VVQLVDKSHAVTAENDDYQQDTLQPMHVPILKRMLEKALPNQKRFYHKMKDD
jgi:hypothetical protein